MNTEITREMIQGMSDEALAKAESMIAAEQGLRTEKRKHDAIAKIKELAAAVSVSVTINGRRGRPPKGKAETAPAKLAKA